MIWRIRVNSCAANPWFRASINGSSQNLQVFRSRSRWTWGGSLQSKLVKKNRYGPGMPLTRGTQGLQFFHLAVIPAFSFQAANGRPLSGRRSRSAEAASYAAPLNLATGTRFATASVRHRLRIRSISFSVAAVR